MFKRNRKAEPPVSLLSISTQSLHSSDPAADPAPHTPDATPLDHDSTQDEIKPPEDSNTDEANNADISSSAYALKCKELLQLNDDIRQLGAGMYIELPRIAVIGGQSAGKSSLVEAVSGINVPRDSGTCTKCPMECYMSSAAVSWSCEISLRFEYGDDGKFLAASRNHVFCRSLTDRASVDIWLRRAQAAILSPHIPIDSFCTKTHQELLDLAKTDKRTLKFSKNVVRIDIRDPDATDLFFVDLPGLIQNESPETIDLIRNLVVSYIRGDKTLILIAIPMSDDMENQQAVRLAREADPTGERTIGVLTKPDTLTQGAISARQKWKDVLIGNAYKTKHGYYCVRLPDDQERSQDIPRLDFQRLASEYFETTSPWKEIIERGRFGIPCLVSNISKLLVELIETTLPKLKQDVYRLLLECHQALASLPKPLTVDPSAEIITRITNFCAGLGGAVYGDDEKSLAQRNRKRYAEFKMHIRQTAPDFRPFVDPENYTKPFFVDEEPAGWPNSGRQRSLHVVEVETLGLRSVRTVIENSIAWELPHNIPFDAKKVLILKFTSLWREPAESCFNDVFATLSSVSDELMRRHFGRFKQLEAHLGSLIHVEIEQCGEQATQALLHVLELENLPLFTQNTHYLESLTEKWLHRYKDARRYSSRYAKPPTPSVRVETPISAFTVNSEECELKDDIPRCETSYRGNGGKKARSSAPTYEHPHCSSCGGPPLKTSDDEMALAALKRIGYPNLKIEDLARLAEPDGYQKELEVMAEVRAYFQVAYKRIIDYVPLTIEHRLNQELVNSLQKSLLQRILREIQVPGRIEELLSEDPAIVKKRAGLEEKSKRLLLIKQKLDEFRQDKA